MNAPSDPLLKLDLQQLAVVTGDPEALALVVAGPGTGKTEVAAGRLLHLLEAGVSPAQILVLSFSRSAARTLADRIEDYPSAGPGIAEELRHVAVRTFDSWAFRVLRMLGNEPAKLLSQSYEANIAAMVAAIRSQREAFLERMPRVRHILVDELQDLGGVRGALVLELLQLFCGGSQQTAGFTVLGDEAQGIYGFAARDGVTEFADITARELFKRIRLDYDSRLKQVTLQKNYRSAPKLASLACSLRNILTREGISASQKLDAMQKIFGHVPAVGNPHEAFTAQSLQEGSAAILTHTNGEAIRVAQLLWGVGNGSPPLAIDLRTASQPYCAPAWVGATLGPAQSTTVTKAQFSKIYSHLYSGTGEALAEAVRVPVEETAWTRLCMAVAAAPNAPVIDLTQLRTRLSWPDAFPDDDGSRAGDLKIMTVHQSKGREFDDVAVLEPSGREAHTAREAEGERPKEDCTEEKASVIFVAITRAATTIKRLEAGGGYAPLTQREFQNGRRRWQAWRKGWMNLEIGISGDLSSSSFVDVTIHGGDDQLNLVQARLAADAHHLRGHKVQLVRRRSVEDSSKFVYGIHLQESDQAGLLLGVTNDQLTLDLLDRLWGQGYGLPQRIYNLRISDVITLGTPEPWATIGAKFAKSVLWNGVQLYGTGDFKTLRRNRG